MLITSSSRRTNTSHLQNKEEVYFTEFCRCLSTQLNGSKIGHHSRGLWQKCSCTIHGKQEAEIKREAFEAEILHTTLTLLCHPDPISQIHINYKSAIYKHFLKRPNYECVRFWGAHVDINLNSLPLSTERLTHILLCKTHKWGTAGLCDAVKPSFLLSCYNIPGFFLVSSFQQCFLCSSSLYQIPSEGNSQFLMSFSHVTLFSFSMLSWLTA